MGEMFLIGWGAVIALTGIILAMQSWGWIGLILAGFIMILLGLKEQNERIKRINRVIKKDR